ncbi:MAG: hypothetical protein AAF228_07125 [Pseudomonadota bacterium]
MSDTLLDYAPDKEQGSENIKMPSNGIRMVRTFFYAAFISIVLAELFWLIPSLMTREVKLYTEVERRAKIAIVAMIEEARFEDTALTKRVGERLMAIGDIKGADIYDREGNKINSFGQEPILSWEGINSEKHIRYLDPSHCCLDMYMPPDETGLSYHLILRLDVTEMRNALWNHITELAGTVFTVATVTCLAVVFQLYFWVALPLKQLSTSALLATAKPWLADDYQIKLKRSDEMGDLAKASNRLFRSVSRLYRNEFNVAKQLVSKTGHAVMQFAPDGTLFEANQKALKLFGVPSLRALKAENQDFFRFEHINSNKPVNILSFMEEKKNTVTCGFLITGKEEIPCALSGTIVENIKDKTSNYVVIVLPTPEHEEAVSKLEAKLKATEGQTFMMKVQMGENVVQNESARILVQLLDGKFQNGLSGQQGPAPFDSVEALTNWSAKVRNLNLSVELQMPQKLPTVMGSVRPLTTLFEQTILLIYLRSEFIDPLIKITARKTKTNGAFEFTFVDISSKSGRQFLPKNMSRQNAEVALKTLSQVLPLAKATIISGQTVSYDKNEFVLSLVGD